MAITVETGEGLSAADALVSVAYVDAYHTARGNTTWTGQTAAKEQAIVRASAFLSNSYRWKGWPVKGRAHADGAQALAWPRAWVTDRYDYPVADDIVPEEVKQACAEIALREIVTPGTMTPDYTPHSRVKMERVGPLAVEYDMSRPDAEGARPVLLIVRDLIGEFLDASAGSGLAGRAVRG